jgi:very-short-patch-repair endonuclease
MERKKPNHPLARPMRNERPNNREYLQAFRTKLRKHLTPAEATLWKALQASKLDGRKFRRQHSIGNYILDFYCPAERLAVELDGEVHRNDRAEIYDHERKQFLNYHGIKVIRFENFLVFEDLEYVLERIKSFFGWWAKDEHWPRRGQKPIVS